MEFRPAGLDLSDSEFDDDDMYVSNQFDTPCSTNRNNKAQKANEIEENLSTYDQYVSAYGEEENVEYIINACMTGRMDVIQDYLQTHNVNDFLNSGWTPLLYAASSVQPNTIQYLLQCGANPNKHTEGYTPLMALCNSTSGSKEANLECLMLLLKANADPKATSKQRQTALMYACKTKEPAFIAELVKHIDNIDFFDGSNKTALMYAVIANRPEIVKLLLENDADKTLTDDHNLSAVDIANQKRFDKIVALLDPDEVTSVDFLDSYFVPSWKDCFPSLSDNTKDVVDFDVSVMLWGMGLEKYIRYFRGIDFKTFLKLKEEDLARLGVDISAHRKQYTDSLHRFYKAKWIAQSMGVINEASPYTIYDGVMTLSAVTKHIVIIDSSLAYVRHSLTKACNENLVLEDEQILKYEEQLTELKKYYNDITIELVKMKALAKKIKRESNFDIPAYYIGPKIQKPKWSVILSLAITLGMALSKTSSVQRLWNDLNIWKIVGSS